MPEDLNIEYGCGRHGLATALENDLVILYPFQKHLLWWEYTITV
jgi:hypothetical protein